jgi:hypothetical protein
MSTRTGLDRGPSWWTDKGATVLGMGKLVNVISY